MQAVPVGIGSDVADVDSSLFASLQSEWQSDPVQSEWQSDLEQSDTERSEPDYGTFPDAQERLNNAYL